MATIKQTVLLLRLYSIKFSSRDVKVPSRVLDQLEENLSDPRSFLLYWIPLSGFMTRKEEMDRRLVSISGFILMGL